MATRTPRNSGPVDAGAGRATVPTLVLHERAGCHLCEDMVAQLGELFAPGSFVLERIDVDRDPALRARYGPDVPVLSEGGSELCRHFLDALAVSERLASYNTPRTSR